MKQSKLMIWGGAALVMVVAIGMLAALFWSARTQWPAFPPPDQSQPSAPQVVAQIERDYGWRTGDCIPVDLYIRQSPGTVVDTNSLAIEGDFEIRTQPQALIVRDRPDGSRWIRLHFDVQSFTVGKSWKLNARISYHDLATGDDAIATVPALLLYTSMTYDGRPDLQQGPQKFLTSWLDLLIVAALILLGIAGAVFGIVWNNRLAKPLPTKGQPKTPTLIVHHNFIVVWRRIQEGDLSARNYEELERNIRWLYKIEPRTLEQVDLYLEMTNHPYHEEVTTILRLCDKRLYQHQYLSDEEHEQIHAAFMRIFTSKPANFPPKPKKPLPPTDGAAAAVAGASNAGETSTGENSPAETSTGDASPVETSPGETSTAATDAATNTVVPSSGNAADSSEAVSGEEPVADGSPATPGEEPIAADSGGEVGSVIQPGANADRDGTETKPA